MTILQRHGRAVAARSGLLVWFAWAAACPVAAGLLVPSVFGNDFAGEFFWGGALGAAQCIVL